MPGAGNHLRAYQLLQRAIRDGHVDDGAEQAAALVFEGGDRRHACALARRLTRTPSTEGLADLHRHLTLSDANPAVLREWVENDLATVMARSNRRATARGVDYGWRASYPLEAALTGFEATDDERLLISARDAMIAMLPHRDDRQGRVDERRRRVLKAWGTDHLDGGIYQNFVTHAGRIAAPMARYAWLVHEAGLTSHRWAAEMLAHTAAETMLEFDDEMVVSDGRAYYWRVAHDKLEAINHQTSAGEALLYLAALTDEPFWRTRARQLAAFVRTVMFREVNGTIVWRYCAPPDAPAEGKPEPIWKSQVTIRFLWHAHRLNAGFNDEDLAEIGRSFRVNVLRDGVEVNSRWSPQLRPLRTSARYGGPINLTPHIILGDCDPVLEDELTELIASDASVGGWLAHPRTALSYAHRLNRTNVKTRFGSQR